MSALRRIFKTVADQWSLLVGLNVTGKNFFRRQVTVHYPRKTVEMDRLETYKGHTELVPKPKDPTKPKCIACMMCASVCPSKCYTVIKAKAPKPTPEEQEAMKEAEAKGEKVKKPKAPKEPAKFILDYSLCSLCGLCVEVCPVGSLRFSNHIYFAGVSRKDFKMNLLNRLKEQAGK